MDDRELLFRDGQQFAAVTFRMAHVKHPCFEWARRVALHQERFRAGLEIPFGIGEGIDDLRPFVARDFVDAMFEQ